MTLLEKIEQKANAFFHPPSLEEVMAERARDAMKVEQQCDYVIRSHEFQRHMARAELDAIQRWRKMQGAQRG